MKSIHILKRSAGSHHEKLGGFKRKGFVLSNSIPFGYIRRPGEDYMEIDETIRPVVCELFRGQAGEKSWQRLQRG